jgi:hypothetical protein
MGRGRSNGLLDVRCAARGHEALRHASSLARQLARLTLTAGLALAAAPAAAAAAPPVPAAAEIPDATESSARETERGGQTTRTVTDSAQATGAVDRGEASGADVADAPEPVRREAGAADSSNLAAGERETDQPRDSLTEPTSSGGSVDALASSAEESERDAVAERPGELVAPVGAVVDSAPPALAQSDGDAVGQQLDEAPAPPMLAPSDGDVVTAEQLNEAAAPVGAEIGSAPPALALSEDHAAAERPIAPALSEGGNVVAEPLNQMPAAVQADTEPTRMQPSIERQAPGSNQAPLSAGSGATPEVATPELASSPSAGMAEPVEAIPAHGDEPPRSTRQVPAPAGGRVETPATRGVPAGIPGAAAQNLPAADGSDPVPAATPPIEVGHAERFRLAQPPQISHAPAAPTPAAGSGTAGGAAGGISLPLLILAVLALTALTGIRSRLLLTPAAFGPLAFASPLERPG